MFKSAYFGGIAGVIVSIIFFVMAANNHAWVEKEAMDYNTVEANVLDESIVLEGDLKMNLGPFVESYSTKYGEKSGKSSYIYLITIGESSFIGIRTNDDDRIQQLNQQMDETEAYWNYKTTKLPTAIHIRGRVRKMDSQSYEYMKSTMSEIGLTDEEIRKYVYPYYIDLDYADEYQTYLIIGIVMLIAAIIILVLKFWWDSVQLKNKKAARERMEHPMTRHDEYPVNESEKAQEKVFVPYDPNNYIGHDEYPENYNTYNDANYESDDTIKSGSLFHLKDDEL